MAHPSFATFRGKQTKTDNCLCPKQRYVDTQLIKLRTTIASNLIDDIPTTDNVLAEKSFDKCCLGNCRLILLHRLSIFIIIYYWREESILENGLSVFSLWNA